MTYGSVQHVRSYAGHARYVRAVANAVCWAEARIKIARMILTIKLDWNWSSFQLANIALPQNVMRCDIAPSARILFMY